MPASGASLLLNAEGLFNGLIAWLVFREATDSRIGPAADPVLTGDARGLNWEPETSSWS